MTPATLTPAQRSRRTLLASMSEADWQRDVIAEAERHGVSWHHTPDSIRARAGYPDLTLWGPGGQAWAELKKLTGRLRPEQRTTLDELAAGGAEVHVWRPGDMAEVTAVMERLGRGRPVVTIATGTMLRASA